MLCCWRGVMLCEFLITLDLTGFGTTSMAEASKPTTSGSSLKSHVDDQRALMNLEFNAQRREYYDKIRSSSLTVVPKSNGSSLYGGSAVDFLKHAGSGRHKAGSIVRLIDTSDADGPSTRCTVLKSDSKGLQLLAPKKFNAEAEKKYKVEQVYWDQRTGYTQALERAEKLLSPLIETLICSDRFVEEIPNLELSFVNKNLNSSQMVAVRNSISRSPLAIIHGPPGTIIHTGYIL